MKKQIIKSEYLPNQEFETKKDLFRALKLVKDELIDSKKSVVRTSETVKTFVLKNLETIKGLDQKDGYSYHVINTTNFYDSHKDLHGFNIWDESVVNEKGTIEFALDHSLDLSSRITFAKDVNMMLVPLKWRDVGVDSDGETNALIFEIKETDIVSDTALKIIQKNLPVQHSVRMQYEEIEFGVDDDSEEFKDEKLIYDEAIKHAINKDEVIKEGYLFYVTKAKISQEGSMVDKGSNSATPILQKNKKEIKTKIVFNRHLF